MARRRNRANIDPHVLVAWVKEIRRLCGRTPVAGLSPSASGRIQDVWHCLESDVVANQQDLSTIPSGCSSSDKHNLLHHSHCWTWWSHACPME